MTTVFFPPTEPRPEVTVERTDTLDVLSAAVREAKLINKTVLGILKSGDRHGDYQVARSAAMRLVETLNKLIETEK